jgi:hypothetical protein
MFSFAMSLRQYIQSALFMLAENAPFPCPGILRMPPLVRD